ncbi:MAG: glycoside hydrolase family 16 protein [Alphaproteobacteria bacterium]|nr:glycoside hydrolase family 16 protein [Alphaproteobacteria bacterium]
MPRNRLAMVAVILVASTAFQSQARAEAPLPFGRGGDWQMIFSDEFDGTSLDPSKWNTCFWWSSDGCTNKGNRDLQWYLPKNVSVDNGSLILTAQPETVTAPDGITYDFTSGMVSTGSYYAEPHTPPLFAAKFGYYETRAKLPEGRGMFPAFWLSPSDYQVLPEIDVVETIGQEPNILTTNFHYRNRDGRTVHIGHRTKTVNLSEDWHVYGIRWRPGAIIWYLDGIEVWRFAKEEFVPDVPMHLYVTLTVGGNWPGRPDKTTPFPSRLLVDYVRVWQPVQ